MTEVRRASRTAAASHLGPGEDALHPVRRPLAKHLGQVPPVLALDGTEQARQLGSHPVPHFRSGEARGDPRMHVVQFLGPALDACLGDRR